MNNVSLQNIIQRQEAIIKTTELLNSTQDTSYILNSLLKESLKYIKGGDAGIIFLFNEKTKYLEPRAYVGFDKEVEGVRIKSNESMTGITFSNKRPMIFKSPLEIQEATSTMEKSNINIIKNTYENLFPKINSSICCPLIFREKCMGVIVVDNFSDENQLTIDDLNFLKSISINAAIAVNNAMNYEREIKNNINLQKYNKIIEKQRNEYQYSTNLHNKLTSMVLEGCLIQDIILELSKILDRDVIIIDLFFNIRNYVLNRSVPFEILKNNRARISQKLSKLSNTVYRFPDTDYFLYLSPIIVSKDNLGWFGIISKNALVSEMDKITIERGSTILALELFRINEMQEMEQKLKGDFLDNLILNQDKEYVIKCSKRYGYNINREHQIMILELNNTSLKEKGNDLYNREFINCQKKLYEFLSKSILKYFPNTISIIKGYNIVFILELNKITKSNLSRTTIEKILISRQVKLIMNNKYKNISLGISNSFSEISNFKNAYSNAVQSLKIGRKIYKDNFIVFYDELETKKILLNNQIEDLKEFVDKTLGNLLNYSNNSRKDFLETLSIYIKSSGNWSYTKDKLHIHGNTLSYRIKRIEEILGIDLSNYNHRLKIQIALEILEII